MVRSALSCPCRWLAAVLFGPCLCLTAGTLQAQSVSDSDFISISAATAPLGARAGVEVSIALDSHTPAMALTIPLTYDGHPALTVDMTVGDQGVTYDPVGQNPAWAIKTVSVDPTAKTILLGFVSIGVPLPSSAGPLATLHFIADSTDVAGVVGIDTLVLPPSNRLTLVDSNATEHIPQFSPGTITFKTVGPTIQLSKTKLTFTGTVDQASPPPQSFQISNVGTGALHWTATPTEPWLAVGPTAGSGDTTITVTVNSAGLPAGDYKGKVVVEDSLALNSPQEVSVTMKLRRLANAADSNYVSVQTAYAPLGRLTNVAVTVDIGTADSLGGIVIPLSYAGSPYVRVDTTIGDKGITYEPLGNDPAWTIKPVSIDTLNQTVLIVFISFFEGFLPAEGPLATIHFVVDNPDTAGQMVLDTLFIPPANNLIFADHMGQPFTPSFSPGAIIMEEMRDSICVWPDSIYIEVQQFTEVLPCASFLIQNCGGAGPMQWSVEETCDWLDVNPRNGTDDSVYVTVCSNTTADPGLFVCTLHVTGGEFIPLPPATVTVYYRVKEEIRPPDPGFQVQLQAYTDSKATDIAQLGVHPEASDGYDTYFDLFEPPPPPGGYVRVYFPHPEWGLFQDEFDADIRAINRCDPWERACNDWRFVVETDHETTVKLRVSSIFNQVPYSFTLRDADGHFLVSDLLHEPYVYYTTGGADTFYVSVCRHRTAEFSYEAGWNLIGSPIQPGNPWPPAIFGPGFDQFQLYLWHGRYDLAHEFNGCGEGYWLWLAEPRAVTYSGTICYADSGAYFCLPLWGRWNLVGNPLLWSIYPPCQISIDSAGTRLCLPDAADRGWVAPDVWIWEGDHYVENQPVTAGRAFWFAAMAPDLHLCMDPGIDCVLVVSPVVNAAPALLSLRLPDGERDVQLGVDERSRVDFDGRFDRPMPPVGPKGGQARLALIDPLHPEYAQWLRDVRPPADVITWRLAILGSEREARYVTVAGVTELMALGYDIYLVPEAGDPIAIESDGEVEITAQRFQIVADRGASPSPRPEHYYLDANFPNPFNAQTQIRFGLPEDTHVDVSIFNLLGRRVRTLTDANYPAGEHDVLWDGRDDSGSEVATGVYFYRVNAGPFSETRKMMMLK